MKIIFGKNLDGKAWPFLPAGKAGALGHVIAGPMGLLRLLETQLGLSADDSRIGPRILQYQKALSKADDGKRFYSKSFTVDAIGTAAILLQWRDELAVSGFAFTADKKTPTRIADLIAVESVFGNSGQGSQAMSERLKACLLELEDSQIDIEEILLMEHLEQHPLLWRNVFDKLSSNGVNINRFAAKIPESQGDLRLVCGALAKTRVKQFKLSGDGSLIVLRPESEAIAAELVAKILNANKRPTVIISESSAPVLDMVLRQNAQPTTGMASASAQRPILQLLPLALSVVWDPPDLNRLMEFITLPLAPGKFKIRTQLAVALASQPGVGGDEWCAVLKNPEFGKDDVETIRYWYECERFQETAAPVPKLVERLAKLAAWAQAIGSNQENLQRDQLMLLAAHARDLGAILNGMGTRISRLALEKWLPIVSSALDKGADAEAGSATLISHPANLLEPVEHVIWFNCAGESLLGRKNPSWRVAELEYLKALGIELESELYDSQQLWTELITPLIRAKERVILISPQGIGDEVSTHPVIEYLAAVAENFGDICFDGLTQIEAKLNEFTLVKQTHHPLPKPQESWLLERDIGIRNEESYSSLEMLFYRPFDYVLNYLLYIKPGNVSNIPQNFTLAGTLSHRMFEILFQDSYNEIRDNQQTLENSFNQLFGDLLYKEGIPFLQQGMEREREQLRYGTLHAISVLHGELEKANLKIEQVEQSFRQEMVGVMLRGKIDLVIANKTTGKTFGVLDLKWAGGTKHRANIQNGADLQLVIYASALRESNSWPERGYYIINNQRLILATPWLNHPSQASQNTPAAPAIWAQICETYEHRAAQLKQGIIEIQNSAPSNAADCLDLSDPPVGYHSYQTLLRSNNG
jgi:hypothetical protein